MKKNKNLFGGAGMMHGIGIRHPEKAIVLFFFLLFAAFGIGVPNADARSTFFNDRGCISCHGAAGSPTCNGCHHHGPSGLKATTVPSGKTTYAPGETVTISLTGGSQSGWIRAILYRDNVEVARSTGTATGGMGGGPGFPITFTTTAPSAPGSYTYAAAWFGNSNDSGSTHGEVRASSVSITVAAAADTTPPTVSSTAPANGATNISPGTAVTALFSEAVTASSVNATTFTLKAGSSSVGGNVTLNGTTATFTPSAPLVSSTTYTGTITTGVRDIAGNAMTANHAWSFTTAAAADNTPPTVTSTNPANNQTGVAVNGSISVTFSEAVAPATVTAASFTVGGVTGTVSLSGNTATFKPSANLAYNTRYNATITNAVTDIATNHLATNYVWSFSTGPASDTTPPTVASTNPVNGATGVSLSASAAATFSEAVDPSTVTTGTFLLKQGSTSVPGTVTLSGTTATFKPSAPLAGSTTYTATMTTGVKDLAGNTMASNSSWTFTTAAAVDNTPPTVGSVSPAAGATGVVLNASVTANFSEAIDALSVNTATFTLKNGSSTVPGTVSLSGATATFKPSASLLSGTAYTAMLTTGIKDMAGNTLGSGYSWTFTTGSASDTTPPTITATSPAVNATGVATNTAVTATFSENLDASTITTATFTLKSATNATVAGVVTYTGNTATFTPNVPLADNTTYMATLDTGIKDAAGNAIAQMYTLSFTTDAQNSGSGSGSLDLTNASSGGGCSVAGEPGSGGSNVDALLILAGLGLVVCGSRIRRRRKKTSAST